MFSRFSSLVLFSFQALLCCFSLPVLFFVLRLEALEGALMNSHEALASHYETMRWAKQTAQRCERKRKHFQHLIHRFFFTRIVFQRGAGSCQLGIVQKLLVKDVRAFVIETWVMVMVRELLIGSHGNKLWNKIIRNSVKLKRQMECENLLHFTSSSLEVRRTSPCLNICCSLHVLWIFARSYMIKANTVRGRFGLSTQRQFVSTFFLSFPFYWLRLGRSKKSRSNFCFLTSCCFFPSSWKLLNEAFWLLKSQFRENFNQVDSLLMAKRRNSFNKVHLMTSHAA